jgi:surface antigen
MNAADRNSIRSSGRTETSTSTSSTSTLRKLYRRARAASAAAAALALCATGAACTPAAAAAAKSTHAQPAAHTASALPLPYLADFATGQCTHYAYSRRPDIVNLGVEKYDILEWNAYRWPANARREGYVVNHHPVTSAIAVWNHYQLGADQDGHVAYVEKVMANGSLQISDVNVNGSTTPHPRILAASVARQLLFIHPQG